jgi:hypothetical protein
MHRIEHRVFGQPADGVVAVGEDEEQRARAIVRIELYREVDGIAQRGRAARFQPCQRRSNRLAIRGHRHGERDLM